jgi:hypothetical protein
MTHKGNILTHKLQIIKNGANKLYKIKFYAILTALTVLAGTLFLTPAISSLMKNVIIKNSGQISATTIWAKSGYWKDIQDAVDLVAVAGGGKVYIPEGTWDFVNVGESWTDARVVVPAGVSIFGTPTERTSGLPYDGVGMNPNDQVVEWKTILRLPWDAPLTDSDAWFSFIGNGNPNKPSRFSDIKLVGYRSFDPNSATLFHGVKMCAIANFRIDHCYFENIPNGLYAGYVSSWDNVTSYGVIDHCYLVNTHGIPAPYETATVGYGVTIVRHNGWYWDDVTEVLGKYTTYTVFIEDCYFEKWRHVTSSNTGAHYVFRHNTVYHDFGYGSVDSHGWFQTACYNPSHGTLTNPEAVWNGTDWVCAECGSPLRASLDESYFIVTQVGTRATEIYNNKITDAIEYAYATNTRGGAGVAFNNIVGGGTLETFLWMWNDNQDREEGAFVRVHDWYIWNNTLIEGCQLLMKYDPNDQIEEGRDYFLFKPDWYQPYPYPHPLTLKESQ